MKLKMTSSITKTTVKSNTGANTAKVGSYSGKITTMILTKPQVYKLANMKLPKGAVSLFCPDRFTSHGMECTLTGASASECHYSCKTVS